MVSLYVVQAAAVVPVLVGRAELVLPLVLASAAVNLVLGVMVVFCVLGEARKGEGDPGKFYTVALAMKTLTIPFFLIHLGLWVLVSAAFLVVPGLQLFLLTGVIGVLYAWGVVLVTSSWAVCGSWLRLCRGSISKGRFLRDVLLELIFVADVAGAAVLFVQARRKAAGAGLDTKKR